MYLALFRFPVIIFEQERQEDDFQFLHNIFVCDIEIVLQEIYCEPTLIYLYTKDKLSKLAKIYKSVTPLLMMFPATEAAILVASSEKMFW